MVILAGEGVRGYPSGQRYMCILLYVTLLWCSGIP